MNSNSINKTKEALAINELLTSAIDIVDDLTNTKIPGYNKTEKANIDHLINSAVEIIYNLQTAKDQDICFDITNFKKTHTNVWTLIELSEFISIMELNVNNVTDPTITTLLEDIDLIKKAIETYNSNKNQQIINDLITSSIDIIYNVNKPISIAPKQTSALANALLQGIYNALDPNTYTSYIPNTYTTMKYVYNISKNTTQNIYSYAVSKKNKYLDILNKKTINGVCEELNNIVIKIADTVCELLNKQKAQAQAQAQAQANLTSSKNGMITIQHSAPCTNPIPAEFQLLGTYDNTELYYNGEENLFCTNNSPQPTVSTTNSSINKKSSSKSIPTTNIRRQDLNALVNIAVDIIDNIKNQNTNIHNLVNAAVDIIVKVKK